MHRDFSENAKKELLALVAQVEDEKLCDFTDWLGDRWYDFESWIGKLDIKNYLDNVNAYHKKVIDKNNTTKDTIEQIFTDVTAEDTAFQHTFSLKSSQLNEWCQYIAELSQIVEPANGNFNSDFMSAHLDEILQKIESDTFYDNLGDYIDFDEAASEYVYHWSEIQELFSKPSSEISEADLEILTFILETMISENGEIDTENLGKFISAGYTIPSEVTATDYHESFKKLANGDKVNYYYIQNKSYVSDTLKTVCAIYSNICEESGVQSDLDTLLQAIIENYSVIEWRESLSWGGAMAKDFWSGELTVSDDALDAFNKMCIPSISIEYINDENDSSGLKYYQINSNASNSGNVRTATLDGEFIWRNDAETDGYSDCTLRVYVGCENLNSNIIAVVQEGRSLLGEYYEEFDWEQELTDVAVNLVSNIPGVGSYIKSLYDVGKQTEIVSAISSGIDGVKSADLNSLTNISKKAERIVDTGLSTASQALGLYTKYKATEVQNLDVSENQDELQSFANSLMEKTNLGYVYDTMVISYEHVSYSNTGTGTGITVDSTRNCDNATCVISPSGYHYDSETLLKQYKTIMNKPNDFDETSPEFIELEKQVAEYISTGEVEEGSCLAQYIENW